MHAPLNALVDDLDLQTVPKGYELVNGQLRELIVGAKSAYVGGNLYEVLKIYCRTQKLGWVFTAEGAYRCFQSKKTVRKPDVSFVRFGRLPNEELPEGDLRILPDLAAEVVSPNDTVYELDNKLDDYLKAGIPLVWVLNPDSRTAMVYRPDGTAQRLTETQELDGENVVPGFRCPLGSLLLPSSS